MNAPPRWTEDPSLAPELGAAVRHEREQGPSSAQLDALTARVLEQMSRPDQLDAEADAGGQAGTGHGRGISLSTKSKIGLGVAVLALGASWASLASVSRAPQPPSSPSVVVVAPAPPEAVIPAPVPAPIQPIIATEVPPEQPVVARRARAKTTVPTHRDAPMERHDPSDEVLLLQRARKAMLNQPEAALALVVEHEQHYAHGVFREEREALGVEALYRSGRKAQAAQRFRAFVTRYPHSAYRERIEPWFVPDSP